VCSLRYAACKVHGLVICGFSNSTIFLSHKWNNKKKKGFECKILVVVFSTAFN